MVETHAALIEGLARDLRPTVRLPASWQRLALWLAGVLWIGLLRSLFTDFSSLKIRLIAASDMWISLLGAASTAVLACWAALQLGIPGRSGKWALLPLPALLVWLGASAAGCLRLSPIAGVEPETAMHPLICFRFLLLVAFPLSALLGWLLVSACPLRPGLTAALSGLASGAAAATLLVLIHPFDATAGDLGAHLAAVTCIVIITRIWGSRALRRRATSPARPIGG